MFGIAVRRHLADFGFANVPVTNISPMQIPRLVPIATLALACVTSAFALNNADVIRMKKANLSDEIILLSINKEPADYDTSVDALIALKEAGISEPLIQKMMAAQKHDPTEPAPAAPAAAPAVPAATITAPPAWANQEFPSIAPPVISPVAGKDYFLRSTIHVEDGKYSGTNYARGAVVPINTPVRLESVGGKDFKIKRLDTGESIKVENVDKYTRKTTPELAALLLSDRKTALESLPSDLADFIRTGDMRRGMTKEQVLMARGYPPAHETSSIDLDRWVYWSSRFVKQTIVFTNGRLTEGRGIY